MRSIVKTLSSMLLLVASFTATAQSIDQCNLSAKQISITDSLSKSCPSLAINAGSDIHIKPGGHLVLKGDVEVFGDGALNIESESKMTIYGDLKVTGDGKLTLDGILNVYGNIIVAGNGEACGSGMTQITGVISGKGWCLDINAKPLSSIEFDAALSEDSSIRLEWTSQVDQSGNFVIERSMNGMTFTMLGTTDQNIGLNSFEDQNLKPGTYYYRIRQTDGDDHDYAHKEIAVTIKDNNAEGCEIMVDPNPCIPSCDVVLTDCPGSVFRTYLLDGAGRQISELVPISENKGNIQYHLSKDNFLMPGVYIIHASSDSTNTAKKVMVK